MTGRRQPPRRKRERETSGAPRETSWERVATWYDGWVGDHGSAYHRELAIPAVLDLLQPQRDEQILDVGGGQGVLAPYLVQAGANVTVLDASARLIAAARRRHAKLRGARFIEGDARRLPAVVGLEPGAFDAAVFMLSIQDMDPLDDVVRGVDWALGPDSRVVLLMTHPAFRQPRHSGWGFDETRKLTYRRIDGYLNEMAVPMKSLGGGLPTRSFHRPDQCLRQRAGRCRLRHRRHGRGARPPTRATSRKRGARRRSRQRRDPDLPGTASRPPVRR